MVHALNVRLKALLKIKSIASFKTRLLIGNGIFMSKLCYMITVWGGCPQYLLAALQVIQNAAMRAVCKQGIRYPITEMLKQTNWLSVKQLVFFHSVMQVWKVVNTRQPVYLHTRLVGGTRPRYADRLAAAGSLVRGRRPRLQLTESSWRWRSAGQWDKVPRDIREISSELTFKRKLKTWVKTLVPWK